MRRFALSYCPHFHRPGMDLLPALTSLHHARQHYCYLYHPTSLLDTITLGGSTKLLFLKSLLPDSKWRTTTTKFLCTDSLTQSQTTAVTLGTAQLLANVKTLGPTGRLDHWMDNIKRTSSAKMREVARDSFQDYRTAERRPQEILRNAFKSVGFIVPLQKCKSIPMHSAS
jgi:hypothetical protein